MKKIKISKKSINIKNEASDEENDSIIEDSISEINSDISNEDIENIEEDNEASEDSEDNKDSEDSEDSEHSEDSEDNEDIEDNEDSEDSEDSEDNEDINNIIINADDNNEIKLSKNINIEEPNSDLVKYLDDKIIKEFLNKPKVTLPLITKFEYSKIKSIRMSQLSNNANPFIKTTSSNIEEIADEEIKQMKLPFIIKRNLPNGDYELWRLNELATR